MENKQDKEYARQREAGQNMAEKAYLPKGGLEAELNCSEEESELAYADWN
jgi:hypothetical protein